MSVCRLVKTWLPNERWALKPAECLVLLRRRGPGHTGPLFLLPTEPPHYKTQLCRHTGMESHPSFFYPPWNVNNRPKQLHAFQQCFNFFRLYFGKFASRVSARAISFARRLIIVSFSSQPGALWNPRAAARESGRKQRFMVAWPRPRSHAMTSHSIINLSNNVSVCVCMNSGCSWKCATAFHKGVAQHRVQWTGSFRPVIS